MCCTIKDDLLKQLVGMLGSDKSDKRLLDYIVMEGSGLAEPKPVASLFAMAEEFGHPANRMLRLDAMVRHSRLSRVRSTDLVMLLNETHR